MSEKAKCVIAYIFGWIGGVIVLFALKDNSKNTKLHAAQAIVLNVGYIIITFIYNVIPVSIPFFSAALSVIYLIGVIMGIVKSSNEENPELPVIGGIAKSIFGKKIEE